MSNPRDLTGLWVAISLYLEELTARGKRAVVCFDSLTALLESVTAGRAYRFVGLLLGRFREANAAAHFHLDPDGCDPGTVANVRSLFDATVPASPGPTTEQATRTGATTASLASSIPSAPTAETTLGWASTPGDRGRRCDSSTTATRSSSTATAGSAYASSPCGDRR